MDMTESIGVEIVVHMQKVDSQREASLPQLVHWAGVLVPAD